MTATMRIWMVALVLILPVTVAWAQRSEEDSGTNAAAARAEHAAPSAHEVATGAEHEEPPGLLSPDLGTAIWTVVLFVVLLIILRLAAWKPILGGLQSRERKIHGDLERAEEAAKTASATLTEYKAKLAAAQAEAQKIMDQGRTEAQRLANAIKEETQSEITAMKKRAEEDIHVAQEQALGEIYTRTATLATDVASKILRRQINPQDQQQLVEESLAELGKAGRG